MTIDVRELLPRDKRDLERARAVVLLGYPAVAPVLPELLEWLQDCNWPVAGPIGDLLASLSEQVAPLVWDVLRGADDIWKYWCIVRLVSKMPARVAEQFRAELTRLAERPTDGERAGELGEVARDALMELWGSRGA
ncbi:MAG TPA: DUF5071 domain-containing protein [Tepidisphaeraceae bacterium]